MNGFFRAAPAAKPGDDLLFHRLSDSTIGAVRFHGRVRDGIGWVTDAMATKLWGRRTADLKSMHLIWHCRIDDSTRAVVDGGILQARIEQLGPVSSTGYPASTSGLSTWWSSTALRYLILREASRLDAFSGYPVHA